MFRRLLISVLLLMFVACGGGGGGGGNDPSDGSSSNDNVSESKLERSRSTALRIIHSSIDAFPVSLRVVGEIFQTARFAQERFYRRVSSGPLELVIERANAPGVIVRSVPTELANDTEYTLFVYGEILSDTFSVELLVDTTEQPEEGFTNVQGLNGLAGVGTVTFSTSAGEVGTAAFGGSSGFVAVPSGVATVTVSTAFGTTLATGTVTFPERGEITLLLTGDEDLDYIILRTFEDLD